MLYYRVKLEKNALKRKIHGIDRMVMANTRSPLQYSNLVEVLTFWAFYPDTRDDFNCRRLFLWVAGQKIGYICK